MDNAVVEQVSREEAGDTARAEAFRRLADRHLAASYRLARAILHDRAEAEDATHDAFLAAWRSWSSLRDPARFEQWFQRILVNTCRNRLRRMARVRIRDISTEIADVGEDGSLAVEDRVVVTRALRQLGPDDRVLLALRYQRDLTVDDIAGLMGIRPGTVKSRLHYALRRVESILDAADSTRALR